MTEQTRKPCGLYHPLPCGLDVDCEVPVECFTGSDTSEDAWEKYMTTWNEDGVD